jgi:xylulokinase
MKYVIAYDMGTGGLKSSLFDENGISAASDFKPCTTYYPIRNFREQKPAEWWSAFVSGTKDLLAKSPVDVNDITALAVSGHSLGVVPIGRDGRLLAEYVPIWNDARADKEAALVFTALDEKEWYLKTGNGFPPQLYSAFKILWYKKNKGELYDAASVFIGTKDYLNYLLTGVIASDYSYASGSGVFDLVNCCYDRDYIKAFGLKYSDFPDLIESHKIIGTIKPEIAAELGLPSNLAVAAGGVDNACMAAGAGCVKEGMVYTSLGTSAWIAVTSSRPVLNPETKPYVFGHLIKGMYTSAESIFSAGNTHKWVRDTICPELLEKEQSGGKDAYIVMDTLAEKSPIGSNGLFFIPTLAGATARDKSVYTKGAVVGLELKHTRGDIIRAALEGICFGLRSALDELKEMTPLSNEMLIVGGGSKSSFWRRLFADIYGMNITESVVGENAGSLGAMACASIGTGLWKDFNPLSHLNKPISVAACNQENHEQYNKLYRVFLKVNDQQSEIADYKNNMEGVS